MGGVVTLVGTPGVEEGEETRFEEAWLAVLVLEEGTGELLALLRPAVVCLRGVSSTEEWAGLT